jgi:hypothetical protein
VDRLSPNRDPAGRCQAGGEGLVRDLEDLARTSPRALGRRPDSGHVPKSGEPYDLSLDSATGTGDNAPDNTRSPQPIATRFRAASSRDRYERQTGVDLKRCHPRR